MSRHKNHWNLPGTGHQSGYVTRGKSRERRTENGSVMTCDFMLVAIWCIYGQYHSSDL